MKRILALSLLTLCSSFSRGETQIEIDVLGNVYETAHYSTTYLTVNVWPANPIVCTDSHSTSVSFDYLPITLGRENAQGSNAAFINYTMLLDALKSGLTIGLNDSGITMTDNNGYYVYNSYLGVDEWVVGTDFSCEYSLSNTNYLKIYQN